MISQDLYEFLTNDLKCPYEGKVQGLGEAYAHLVVTKDSTPNDLSENISGNFYQPNYVSVVAPQAKTDDEIGKKILDQSYTKDQMELMIFGMLIDNVISDLLLIYNQ